jgi:uncharacterized protein (DUF2336 family)
MVPHQTLISTIENALKHGAPADRVEALRYVSDLFEFGSEQFSDDQIAEFDLVLMRLIAEVEISARVMLANRLASIRNAPPSIIRNLAFDDAIDVAGPILTRSGRLSSAILVENAKTKGQAHLLAISRRASVEEPVTDILVERGDSEVLRSAAANPGAKFSDGGFAKLVERSQGDDILAACVGGRRDIPRHHFLKLLAKASQTVRAKLEAEDPLNTAEIQRAVATAASLMQARSAAVSRDYAKARARVGEMRASGRLAESDVHAFAKAGQFEDTTVALALLCDLPVEAVERAMVQDRAETILIIARAAGLDWRSAKAVLLLRAGSKGMAPHELEQCLSSYARLKFKTAQEIVRFQRKRIAETDPRMH